MKKTKIVCTIGPASENIEMIGKLMDAGMNICRLNFSHGDHAEQGARIKNIRALGNLKGNNVAILLDTKGPEVRLGEFENEKESFEKGDIVTLVREKILGNKERFHIQVPEVFDDVEVGGVILMDDGKMKVTILEKRDGELVCRVENPHVLKSKKGCNLPGVRLSMPFISPKDDSDIRFGCKMGVDYIAASFTRRKDDVLAIRKILEEEGKPNIQIIAKIENQEGFDNLDEILEVADGIMVARGDLGVDVSFEMVPILQKEIIARCNKAGKPVITATHMLESMSGNPRPTRAEASDVANAILDGTDCIMTSGETAAGMYPVETVQTMVKIAAGIEERILYREHLSEQIKSSKRTKEDAMAIAVADMALAIDVKAIVVFTQSGVSAKRISKYRPVCDILAVTFDPVVERSLAANWGIHSMVSDQQNTKQNESDLANIVAIGHGLKVGDTVLIVSGYPTGTGATNTLRIFTVREPDFRF